MNNDEAKDMKEEEQDEEDDKKEEEEVLTMDKAMRMRKEAQLRLKAWRVVWGKRQMKPEVGVDAWRKTDKVTPILDMDSAYSEVNEMRPSLYIRILFRVKFTSLYL